MTVKKLGGSERAFTLIELMVVIGAIVAISATLLPVFFAARERGRRTQCLSNERQLGMAVSQYAADNNETLFVAGADGHGYPWAGDGLGWAGRCYPYVKAVSVFRCPDDATADVPANGNGSRGDSAMYAVSYGFNSNLRGVTSMGGPSFHSIPPVMLGQIGLPARTVLLFEVSGDVAAVIAPGIDGQSAQGNITQGSAPGGPDGPLSDYTYPSGYSADPPGSMILYATGNVDGMLLNGATKDGVALPHAKGSDPRHGDGANYAACDGHVIWLRPKQVSPGPPDGTGATRYALAFSYK